MIHMLKGVVSFEGSAVIRLYEDKTKADALCERLNQLVRQRPNMYKFVETIRLTTPDIDDYKAWEEADKIYDKEHAEWLAKHPYPDYAYYDSFVVTSMEITRD